MASWPLVFQRLSPCRHLGTVGSETSKLSRSSSPWMRGAPRGRVVGLHLPDQLPALDADGGSTWPGVTLDDALQELEDRRIPKPDLFLLDLYYGPDTTPQMRDEIAAADERLATAEAEVRRLLVECGQSPDAGFKLAAEAHRRYPSTHASWPTHLRLSIAVHRGRVPPDTLSQMGITPDLVQISVGLEDVEDLISDLETALNSVVQDRTE